MSGGTAWGVLRLRIRNEGEAASVLVAVTDAAGVPRALQPRMLPARSDTFLPISVPVGQVASEVHAGTIRASAASDLARCPARLVQQNYTLVVSATSWSVQVGGAWCVSP